jgi:hypothetical protein
MSPSERSEAPSNYPAFHIQYRHSLITEYGLSMGVVDGVILPRRIPQLYHVWRHLRTGDNALEVARQFAKETYQEGNFDRAQGPEEEIAERVANILIDRGYKAEWESPEETPQDE